MAIRGNAITIGFTAWDYALNIPKTADTGAMIIQLVLDGAAPVPSTNSPLEVDAVNSPGKYKLTLTAAEMNHNVISVSGKSSANVALFFGGDIITEQNYVTNTYQNTVDMEGIGFVSATDSLHAAQVALNVLAGQINNIVATGAAVNQIAEAFTLTTGSVVAGTYINTFARDGVYHQLADTAGTLDCYYRFDVGLDGVPTGMTYFGHITSANDLCNFWGWNFNTGTWIQLGTVAGISGATNAATTFAMFTSMVGTDGLLDPTGSPNPGKVFIRLQGTGLTLSNNYVDQLYVSYAVVRRTVGYANGKIWVDTTSGHAGTVSYINGTADYPVNNWADALILSIALGIHEFDLANGSNITLTSGLTNATLTGESWMIALGGQALSGVVIDGASVSGICVGTDIHFKSCHINTITVPSSVHFVECYFMATTTFSSSGDVHIYQGASMVAGDITVNTIIFDFNSVADVHLSLRGWAGGITIKNTVATSKISFNGWGRCILDTTCLGGNLNISGNSDLIDNSAGGGGGALTINQDARYDIDQPVAFVSGDIDGKILGGGASVLVGVGVRAVDSLGNAIAPAASAVDNTHYTNARGDLLSNLDVAVSTRSTLTQNQILSDATPFAGANINATISSRSTLTAANVWSELIPGAYGPGTAGEILGDNLDAKVSTRSTYSGGAVASVTGDVGGKILGNGASAMVDTGVRAVDSAGNAVAPASTAISNIDYTAARAIKLDNLDATVLSRADQTTANAIKTNTDFIPAIKTNTDSIPTLQTSLNNLTISQDDIQALLLKNSVLQAISYNVDGNMIEGEIRSYDSETNASVDDGITGLRKKWRVVQVYNNYKRPAKLTGTDKPQVNIMNFELDKRKIYW